MSKPFFAGVQMAAESILLEGAPHVLTLLQQEGAINTVLVGTHGGGYGVGQGVASRDLAHHNLGLVAAEPGQSPSSFIDFHPQYYRNTLLGQERVAGLHQFAERDVLRETIEAATPLGMRVYARHLEGFHPSKAVQMTGLVQVASVDCYGRKISLPCWNHPDYRAWWLAMGEEWCKEYEIDGLILGPERDAPLAPLLYSGQAPYCFCDHCRERGARQGIDFRRAQSGFRTLHELLDEAARTNRSPVDGMMVSVLRLLFKWPEIIQWENLQNDAKWCLHAAIYGVVKTLRPGAQVGWMVPVYPLMHDIVSRALCYDYAEMAPWSDFLKLNVYQDVNAARLHDWIDQARGYLYRDLSGPQLHDLIYSVFGYDSATEPSHESSATEPFSGAYIKREVMRCKAAVAGRCSVYAGIGINVPHDRVRPQTPADAYAAARAALESGADGLLLSREYEFMQIPHLNAVRQALKDAGVKTS